ncbi:hypothetical protein CLV40_1219 [Actinokineospora auranticolor]|uniref:Uncharacterized protein n=1 Tax=Actinokineospora auranticolor TaxID=155976 RepID=A0A2S6GG24_9PSEU|nr:hypothetical protein CLV40_1219 [Actinokineospora auranticolor]
MTSTESLLLDIVVVAGLVAAVVVSLIALRNNRKR